MRFVERRTRKPYFVTKEWRFWKSGSEMLFRSRFEISAPKVGWSSLILRGGGNSGASMIPGIMGWWPATRYSERV